MQRLKTNRICGRTFVLGVVIVVFQSASIALALPVTLYDRPLSDPWWDLTDNSGLTKIILENVLTDLYTPWSLKWDVTNGDLYECHEYDVHLEWITGYVKSYTGTTNTTVNAELGAEFKGIGAKIGLAYEHALMIGEEQSKIEKDSIDTTVTLGCLQNGKYYVCEIYDLFTGSYEWFDDVGPHTGGLTRYGTWSAKVYHGHGLWGPIKSGGQPCIPEPASLTLGLLGLGSLAALLGRRES
jgi:hypothetical protein